MNIHLPFRDEAALFSHISPIEYITDRRLPRKNTLRPRLIHILLAKNAKNDAGAVSGTPPSCQRAAWLMILQAPSSCAHYLSFIHICQSAGCSTTCIMYVTTIKGSYNKCALCVTQMTPMVIRLREIVDRRFVLAIVSIFYVGLIKLLYICMMYICGIRLNPFKIIYRNKHPNDYS